MPNVKIPFAITVALNGATVVPIKTAATATTVVWLTKAVLSIVTHAAKFVAIQDTTGTPVVFCKHNDLTAAAGVPSVVTWDFGKHGIPMTTGKDLGCVSEASGVAGYVYAEGYTVG